MLDFRRNNISSHRLYFYVIFTNFEEGGGYIMFDNIFMCLCIFTNYSVLSSVVRWRIFFYCKEHTIVMVSFSPNQNMMRISWISRKYSNFDIWINYVCSQNPPSVLGRFRFISVIVTFENFTYTKGLLKTDSYVTLIWLATDFKYM